MVFKVIMLLIIYVLEWSILIVLRIENRRIKDIYMNEKRDKKRVRGKLEKK